MPCENYVSVIIVNWNSGRQIFNCVNSINENCKNIVREIIVIDNGSSDGSELLIDGLPRVNLTKANDNLGFGKACNIGAYYTSGEFLLFLNPDAAIYPDGLDRVVSFMNDPLNIDVGICGVQLIDEAGHVSRSCCRFPGPFAFLFNAVGLDRLFPRLGHFMAEWSHDTSRDVDHLIGAFFFVRRKLFEQLGGFDEQFFVYLEDLDFSKRAHNSGWRSVYLADVQAFHAGGGTSNQVKARRLFYSLRSRLLYANKHFGKFEFVTTLLATMFIEPVSRMIFALFRGSVSGCKETWFAYGMLWEWLPQWGLKGVTR